jgi:4-hydroxyphenylpyruvate dioxygenase
MRLCVATTTVPGDLSAKLEAIAEAGFQSIELHEPDLTGFVGSPLEVGKMAAALGLEIAILQPFLEFEGQQGEARDLVLARLDKKMDLMAALGAKTLLVGTSTDKDALGEFDAICSDFEELASRSAAKGLRAALIALPWAHHLQNETDALRVIEAVDSQHLGLALNSFFSLADGSLPARLRDIPAERIFHVQLSDAPNLHFDFTRLKNHFGLLPGQGDMNLPGFVRALARSGYDGPWSVAHFGGQIRGTLENHAKDAYRALVSLIDEVARTEPAVDSPVRSLPPRVSPSGFEFIEFASDHASGTEISSMLQSLCFRRERTHVSKSVELWRQGAINIVLNSECSGLSAESFASHGPSVCDIGLRVKNADQTIARAKALGSSEFAQPVGVGELDIPAIKGVGGSIVHFIDEKSDLHRVWDIEFKPVSKTQSTQPAGLRRIDHVAQTMRYQEMQSWVTYYTTTFEMEKAQVFDVADPSGVVPSQAVASPEGEVRLNLNGAGESRTFAGGFLADQMGAGVQHIAFLTDDIFETSVHLDRAGFERLQMPANYYDDLGVAFGLDEDLIAKLCAGNILYDRDGGAEYFQIYSLPIFKGFFFEIVERRPGYQGYGARNATFRLAAQTRYLQENGRTAA